MHSAYWEGVEVLAHDSHDSVECEISSAGGPCSASLSIKSLEVGSPSVMYTESSLSIKQIVLRAPMLPS